MEIPDKGLTGRCIVYAQNISGDATDVRNPTYPLYVAAVDFLDFFELFTGHKLDEMCKENFSKMFDEIKKKVADAANMEIEKALTPVAVYMSQVESLEDLTKYEGCDIIDAGEISNIAHASPLFRKVVELYILRYQMQQANKIPVSNGTSKMPSYTDISKEEFKKQFAQLASRLMREHEKNKDSIFIDMKKLAKGAPAGAWNNIVNFYQISRTNQPHKIALMDLHMQEMFAKLDERYNDIVDIRKEIKGLLEKNA